MDCQSPRTAESEVEYVVDSYSKMLFRLCFSILGNSCDAEDAVSETLIRYLSRAPEFQSEDHRRAWLITVARNICKNMLRSGRRESVSLEELGELAATERDREVLLAVLELPEKYREVLHLHYIEGYRVKELAGILGLTEFAVKKRLQYGRERLRLELERED